MQGPAKLIPLQSLRWNLAPVGKIPGEIVALFIVILLVDRLIQKLSVFAPFHAGFVHGYLDEPRAELGFSAEGTQVGKGLKERLLGGFFGTSFVLQNRISSKIDWSDPLQ